MPTLSSPSSRLALFDLDNTLLANDSDHLWGEFLIAEGLVDAEQHKQKNDQFYRDYCDGSLDINAYLKFVMQTVKDKTASEVAKLHHVFMRDYIEALCLPKSEALIAKHREAGDTLAIITATSDFITQPIAARLGIDTLLASQAEIINGRYTGQPTGTPCFASGKITNLNQWLDKTLLKDSSDQKSRESLLQQAIFYSDSHNDIPLLASVGTAIAVDPDPTLTAHAKQHNWQIISLRD